VGAALASLAVSLIAWSRFDGASGGWDTCSWWNGWRGYRPSAFNTSWALMGFDALGVVDHGFSL
jgi:hypothetical protein